MSKSCVRETTNISTKVINATSHNVERKKFFNARYCSFCHAKRDGCMGGGPTFITPQTVNVTENKRRGLTRNQREIQLVLAAQSWPCVQLVGSGVVHKARERQPACLFTRNKWACLISTQSRSPKWLLVTDFSIICDLMLCCDPTDCDVAADSSWEPQEETLLN